MANCRSPIRWLWTAAPLLAPLLTLSGCSRDPTAQLISTRNQAEFTELRQVEALLSSTDELQSSDIQVFIGSGPINEALQKIGSVEIPLRNLGDTILTISDARVAFTDGYPAVSLKARVVSAQRHLSADAVASAILLLDASPNSLSNSTLRVELTDIAPRVTLGPLAFSLKGFWKELSAAVIRKELIGLPAFSLPLNTSLTLTGGGTTTVTMPTGNGSSVTGDLIAPSVSANIGVRLRHVIFLGDGVHLFLSTELGTHEN